MLLLVSSHNYSAIFLLDDLFFTYQKNPWLFSYEMAQISISTVSFFVVGQANE